MPSGMIGGEVSWGGSETNYATNSRNKPVYYHGRVDIERVISEDCHLHVDEVFSRLEGLFHGSVK